MSEYSAGLDCTDIKASLVCQESHSTLVLQVTVAALLCLGAIAIWYHKRRAARVYLLDFACYKPAASLQMSMDQFLWGSRRHGLVPLALLSFSSRGQVTCLLTKNITFVFHVTTLQASRRLQRVG